ncbi:MAG TPA: RNA polymerase subunit sigma-70 [Desulfosporosinus sp.]|jgi:RNA polymerase sigma factor (sigma-70 family)|nr:RNA polymerase subunit sigma-70 [Desulfosporosinus sp.]
MGVTGGVLLIDWECLLKALYPNARSKAYSLLRDGDLAQDAVQNAMIKVYKNLPNLQNDQAFFGWWQRILMNEIYLLLRLKRREVPGIEPQMLREKTLAVEDYVVMKVELAQAIKGLPLKQQQMILDVDVRGDDLKKVANDYGLPIGTVKSRLFRARAKLQENLEHSILKQKERGNMINNLLTQGDRAYNYLDGTMDYAERTTFELELDQNPEWRADLDKHKKFLTLLHSLTGRITLTAEDIKEKVQSIQEKIMDYEIIVDDTHYENGTAKTTTTHNWFKNPDCYRMEYNVPAVGSVVICAKDNYVMSWAIETKKATKVTLSEEYKAMLNHNYIDALKRMTENKSSRVLDTEYMKGRPTLHIQFTEKVAELGEMSTHLWMDKDTWMPIVTEYYNIQGNLVNRREVMELRINQEINDSMFELVLPHDVIIDERLSIALPQDITFEKATQLLGYAPYTLVNSSYKSSYQWVKSEEKSGLLNSLYTVIGEQFPKFILSQGGTDGKVLSTLSDFPKETVKFIFNADRVEAVLYDMGASVGMFWEYKGVSFSCGGQLDKHQILEICGELTQEQ